MQITQGTTGITRQVATTDTAATLPNNVLYADGQTDGPKATAVHISVESNPLRFAFNVDPTQAGLGHLAGDGDTIRVVGFNNIEAMKVISSGAGSPATMQVTAEFGQGVEAS